MINLSQINTILKIIAQRIKRQLLSRLLFWWPVKFSNNDFRIRIFNELKEYETYTNIK